MRITSTGASPLKETLRRLAVKAKGLWILGVVTSPSFQVEEILTSLQGEETTLEEVLPEAEEAEATPEEASLEVERQAAADSPAGELLEEADILAAEHLLCRLGTRILRFVYGA